MNEGFEYKGYWWLPDNPDKTVAGMLKYIPNESIKLELIGTFESEEQNIVSFEKSNDKKIDIILGITSDSKEVTLCSNHSYGSLNLSCPFPIITFNSRFVVVGKHLENFDQKSFYQGYVKIKELNAWSPPSVIETFYRFNKSEDAIESVSITFTSPKDPIVSTTIDENTKLAITSSVTYQGDHYSPKIEQYSYLEILKTDNASINDFLRNVHMFEQFLSLATLQDVKCSSITLFDKTIYQEYKEGKRHYHPIQLIYVQRVLGNPIDNKSWDYLFDYSAIKDKYEDIILKWFTDHENIAPIKSHLLNSIKSNGVFSSVDFLIVIQAIEGFCSRCRKEQNLSKMIEDLITEFSDIRLLSRDNIIVEQVVDSRHYYSHFFDKSKKKNIVDGVDLFYLTAKLRRLLICCILNFIGFSNDKINDIFTKSNNKYIKQYYPQK